MNTPAQTSDDASNMTLRDQIASIIQQNWPFTAAILWENMPVPSPLPASGWVEMRLRHGRARMAGLHARTRYQRGSVQFNLASHIGKGMEDVDAMLAHLIALFQTPKTAQNYGLYFGQANVQPAQKEDGFLITTMTIRFSYNPPNEI